MAKIGGFNPLDESGLPAARLELARAFRDLFDQRTASKLGPMSLEDCAARAGCGNSTVSRLIHGRLRFPSESKVLSIYDELAAGLEEPDYTRREILEYVTGVKKESRAIIRERRETGGKVASSGASAGSVLPVLHAEGDRQHRAVKVPTSWSGIEDLRRRLDNGDWSSVTGIVRHAGKEVDARETADAIITSRDLPEDSAYSAILAYASERPPLEVLELLAFLSEYGDTKAVYDLLKFFQQPQAGDPD